MINFDFASRPLFASQRAATLQELARAGRPPLDRFINIVGDSRQANSIGGAAPAETHENYGIAAWLPFYTGGRVRIGAARKSATPGYNSKQVLDNMDMYIAAGGDVFFNLYCTNDRNPSTAFPLGTSKKNLEAGLRKQLDAGKIPIMLAELPRGGEYALSGEQLSYHLAMREWQLTRLPEMGVRVGDAWPYLVDPDNEHLALPRPELYVDQLHLNGIGAPLAVRAVAPHFIDLFGVPLELPTYDAPYDDTYNPRGWLTSNPLLLGMSGTKNGTANATGPLATGFSLAGTNWTGATVTLFQEPSPLGGNYQGFELGGTPTAAGSTLIMEQVIPLANVTAGDIIRAVALTAFENLQGVGGVSIDFRFVRGGTVNYVKSLDRYAEGSLMWAGPGIGPQETPFLTVDPATDTEIKMRAVIYGCQNVPIRGTVRIGNLGCQKVL